MGKGGNNLHEYEKGYERKGLGESKEGTFS